jgi:hypothetical protein
MQKLLPVVNLAVDPEVNLREVAVVAVVLVEQTPALGIRGLCRRGCEDKHR